MSSRVERNAAACAAGLATAADALRRAARQRALIGLGSLRVTTVKGRDGTCAGTPAANRSVVRATATVDPATVDSSAACESILGVASRDEVLR
jgi:hypothetical protein